MIVEKGRNDPGKYKALNKAISTYVKDITETAKSGARNEHFTYSDFLQDKMMIIRVIRHGLPYALFSKIQEITPFTEDDWADYLNLSKKTLTRHKNESNYFFKPIHTEKIIELAEVTNYGKEVFNSTEQFYTWLNTPSFALGNLKPAELLKDSYGKELVMAELNRIEQGIFV